MTGTLLNALAIVAGSVAGLCHVRPISAAGQGALKVLLGVATVWTGLSTTWAALHGTFLKALGLLGLAVLALMLGHATGKLLRIQASLNRLGHYAKERFTEAQPGSPPRASEGFLTCTILFAGTPLAVFGAVLDGLDGNWHFLAIKAVMDGLAAMAFASTFGLSALGSVVPVVAVQGTLTLLARALASSSAGQPAVIDTLNAATGLVVFSVSLVILNLKKVDLADYLPALFYAPLLAWWVYGSQA